MRPNQRKKRMPRKGKHLFKTTTSNREYNAAIWWVIQPGMCPYCGPFQGENGNLEWWYRGKRSWKENRKTQWKQ